MGGGTATTSTIANAPETVTTKLVNSAKKQLEQKGKSLPDGTSWDKAVAMLGEMYFNEIYMYQFSDRASKPRQALPNTTISPVKKWASVVTNDTSVSNRVTQYFDDIFSTQIDAPDGIKKQAVQDLIVLAMDLVNRPATEKNEWYQDAFSRKYQLTEDQYKGGNKEAYQADFVFHYCNSQVTSGGKTEQLLVVSYVGVYYQVLADTEERRNQFRMEAISKAKEVTHTRYLIKNVTDLKTTLLSHCKENFKQEFKYDYGDKPPNSTKVISADTKWFEPSASMTGVAQRTWVEGLAEKYCENIGSVAKDVKDLLQQYLKNFLKDFVSDYATSPDGAWQVYRLSVAPESKDVEISSVFNGYLCYFSDQATTNANYDTALTYVMIMGVFYETKSLKKSLDEDLYDRLVRRLPDVADFEYQLADENTKQESTLEKFTLENAKILFKRHHKIDWSRPRLPISKKDEKLIYDPTFAIMFKSADVTSEDKIERQVNNVFNPESPFDSASDETVSRINEDLVKMVQSCVAKASSKPDEWQSDHSSKEYRDGKIIFKHYATYLFVNGTTQTGNIRTRQFFLQYLGVITSRDPGRR